MGGAARSPGAGMLGTPCAVLTRGHWRVKLACPGFLSFHKSSQDFLFKMQPRPAPPLTLARLVTGEIPKQPFGFTLFSRLPLPKRPALSSSSHPCFSTPVPSKLLEESSRQVDLKRGRARESPVPPLALSFGAGRRGVRPGSASDRAGLRRPAWDLGAVTWSRHPVHSSVVRRR